MTVYDSGVVTGAGWSLNSVGSTSGSEVKLLTGAGGDWASMIATSSIPTVFGTIKLSGYCSGAADTFGFGICDAAGSKTLGASQGVESVPTFWGALLDVWNSRVVFFAAGAQVGVVGLGGLSNGVYSIYQVTFENVSTSSTKITLTRDGTVLATYTHTARPAFSSASMAIGGRTGGSAMNAWVKDTPTFTDFDLSAVPLTNLVAVPFSTALDVTWSTVVGASSYDYRINGGAPVSVSTTSTTITGLTNGVPVTVEVRGVNTSSTTAWASVTATPAVALIYDTFERANVTPSSTALGNSTDGKTWTQPSGILGITGGQLYSSTSGENDAIFSATSDQDVRLKSANTSAGCGMIFRYRDTNNYWLLQPETAAPTGYALYRKINGSFVNVIPLQGIQPIVAPAEFRALAVGKAIRIYINGVLRETIEDYFSLVTDVGLGVRLDNSVPRVDSFYARTPAASEMPDSAGSLVTEMGIPAVNQDFTKLAHVYKGRDTKTLDSVGVS